MYTFKKRKMRNAGLEGEGEEVRRRGEKRRGEGRGGWQISLLAFNSVEDKGEEVLISLNQQLDIESVI